MTTRKEIAGSLAVVLFGVVFLAYATRYPRDTWENPGPAVFPLILGAVLVILAGGRLVHTLWKAPRKDHRDKHGKSGGSGAKQSLLRNIGDGKALRMIALFALYLLGMQGAGFFVSTFLFGVATSRLAEKMGWGKPAVLSAGITLFCYLLFEVWLKMPFPRGILF